MVSPTLFAPTNFEPSVLPKVLDYLVVSYLKVILTSAELLSELWKFNHNSWTLLRASLAACLEMSSLQN